MIRLEHFQEEDFNQLIEWIHDEEIMMNWAGNLFRFPLSIRSLEWYIKDTNIINDSSAYVYKAIDANGKTVGHVSLGGISWQNRSARITRVLVGNTAERGQGCCQGIIKAALKIAFEDLDLHRVSLGVYKTNAPATRCYENAGFVTEGIHRDILWHKDSWWSMIEMSILQKEWRILNGGAGCK